MMKNSTLQKLSFGELKSKHRVLSKMLYLVGLATLICVLVMLYSIINAAGISLLNILFGVLAIALTLYLYNLSNMDTQVFEEMWMRRYQKD